MHLSAPHGHSLARITFGEPIEGMPEVTPPYTPPQPRPSYQAGLMRLERHRQARMDAAATAEDWDAYERWQDARVMPALLVGAQGKHPETVPGLVTELLWDAGGVTARVLAATPDGNILPEDVTLLRLQAGQYVAYAPVIHAR